MLIYLRAEVVLARPLLVVAGVYLAGDYSRVALVFAS